MPWIQVGLSLVKTRDEITQTLRKLFPATGVLALPPQNWPLPPWPEIVFGLYENESEFPTVVSFYKFPGEEEMDVPIDIEVARLFSEAYNCRTICDGSGLPDYGDGCNLYRMVVWDENRSFYADEVGSRYGQWEEDGPVEIIREMKFPKATLDAFAEVVNIDWQND